jgi:hypothetical protein
LRNIPEEIRRLCIESGVVSKSLLLQIARQPTERKMAETLQRILQGGLTRDEARRERREEAVAGPRPQPFIFNFQPDSEAFRLRIQFRKSSVSRDELIATLRAILASLEQQPERAPQAQLGPHIQPDQHVQPGQYDVRDQNDEQAHDNADPAVA